LTSLCLPARVDEDAALRFFSRPRPGNLFGLLAQPVHAAGGDSASRVPPFIEPLWLPAHAVRVHATSPKGERSVWTAVEGINGEFSLLECDGELAERDITGDVFPPSVNETRAAELAREGMMRYILSQRGQINKPVVDGIEEVRPYHYPVWVCYYRRRRVFLDIMVLDARTGKSGGAKMRIAVLHALVARRKESGQAERRINDSPTG